MLSSRVLVRLGTLVTAIAVAVSAGVFSLGGSGALASNHSSDRPGYLALGDSVVFGYIAGDGFAYVNPSNFVGYPAYAGRDLRLDSVNAACPGEASGGFRFVAPGGNDNGCRPYRANFPLHVAYSGTQLSFATRYLRGHRDTSLVTLGLGANDAFILQRTCPNQACLLAGLAVMSANIDAILGALRATGYDGVLEVVNYYSLDYADPAQVGLTALLNKYVTASAKAHHAVIADAFTAFQAAAARALEHTCAAGLLNASPNLPTPPALPTCDVHPSQSGQQLLAHTVEAAYGAATSGGRGN